MKVPEEPDTATNRPVEDHPAFCLLLPDGGEGPLRMHVVFFVAGLTAHTNKQL